MFVGLCSVVDSWPVCLYNNLFEAKLRCWAVGVVQEVETARHAIKAQSDAMDRSYLRQYFQILGGLHRWRNKLKTLRGLASLEIACQSFSRRGAKAQRSELRSERLEKDAKGLFF